MNPAQLLAQRVLERRKAFFESQVEPPSSSHSNRASELGHPCLRYLVLQRTRGNEAEPMSATLVSLFREGRLHETDVKKILSELGIDIYGTQDSFPPNNYQITGHIDGRYTLRMKQGEDGGWALDPDGDEITVGIEVKSLNPWHYDIIQEAKDLLDPSLPYWLGKWYTQSQLYQFLSDVEWWLFIVKNKLTGEWNALPMQVDLDYIEKCLDKALEVNAYVENYKDEESELPEFLADPSICRTCRFFKRACFPPEDHGEGAVLLSEKSPIVALLARIAESHDTAATHRRDDKDMKGRVKLLADGKDRIFLAGDFIVTAKHSKNGACRVAWQRTGETEAGDDS